MNYTQQSTLYQLKKYQSQDIFQKFISPYPTIYHKYTQNTINTNSTSNNQPNSTLTQHHHYQSSIQSFNHQQPYCHAKQQYDVKDRLILIYQSQNNNLKQHNIFLSQQLRKQQKKSAMLNQQLDIIKLQINMYKSPEVSQSQQQHHIISKQQDKTMENILERMDNEFKKMVEEYCKDDSNQNKTSLRFSLAGLAKQIKQIKNIIRR